ncbi:MAG: AAA family ATPase [Nanoarchaeota archaeon]
MILRYLKLHNIRSYLTEKIDFPTGPVLLSGDIGSGKSTILLAIEFALFGLKRGEFTGASLLRNGESEGSVELKFIIDKGGVRREIIIFRSLKRTANSIKQDAGHVTVNGQRTDATPVELKSMILSILGYPETLLTKSKDLIYRYTVYTPQEDMKQILFAEKEERLNTLRRVFNIDKYKRIRDNLSTITKEIREQTKILEGRTYALPEKTRQYRETIREANDITKTVKELLPQIKQLEQEIADIKTREEELNRQHLRLKEIKSKLEYKEQELRSRTEQIMTDEETLKAISKSIAETQQKIKTFGETEISEAYVAEQDDAAAKALESLNEKRNENILLKERVASLKDQIKTLQEETKSKKQLEKQVLEKRQELKNAEVVTRQKPELEKNIEKIEKIITTLQNKITETGVKYASAEKVISDVKELDDCPTCHQKVTEEYKKEIIKTQKQKLSKFKDQKKEHEESLAGYEKRLETSRNNIKNILEKEKDIEKIKADIDHLETSIKEFDQKKNRIEEMEKKKEHFASNIIAKETLEAEEKAVKEKQQHLKSLQEQLSRQKEKKYLQESLKEKEERKDELEKMLTDRREHKDKLEDEMKTLRKEEEGFKTIEKDSEKLKKVREEKEEKDKELTSKKASLLSTRESLVKTKGTLEDEIKKMREHKERITYLAELKTWLGDHFANITSVIERNVMMRVFNEFNELFKEWFNMLIEDEVISVRLDDEFTPIVEQNGYEISIDDLSGGEKTSCALAYRLALNKVINDTIDSINTDDLIILDEPTDGFSSEQLDKLRDVLEQLRIGQIVIVSHETKIESFVDNIIRISKAEHVSTIA